MKQEPSILFQDNDLLILDKPSGMTVNRSDTTREETVQDWLEKEHMQKSKTSNQSDFFQRSGIVHRLDKETSGILIVAKNESAFLELQRQFKERLVEKSYTALVHGKVIPEHGEILAPVGRLSFNRKRFGVIAGGRQAVTTYNVMRTLVNGQNEEFSLLELYPKTGRTHQIRVHLKYIHHPVVSDELYAGRKTARNDRKALPRLFLHAGKISIIHPSMKEKISFESPLPHELQSFLKELTTMK